MINDLLYVEWDFKLYSFIRVSFYKTNLFQFSMLHNDRVQYYKLLYIALACPCKFHYNGMSVICEFSVKQLQGELALPSLDL